MELIRTTQSLIVRPLVAEDYNSWSFALSSLSAKKHNEWDISQRQKADLSEERFDLILSSQASDREEDQSYELGVFLSSGAMVGLVSLMEVIRGAFQNAFLGYRIYHHHWGKGYGKEATGALIEIAFEDLKLHRIEAAIAPGNHRSIRLAQSLGMRYEGLSCSRLYLEGRWQDMEIYALTSEERGIQWRPLA